MQNELLIKQDQMGFKVRDDGSIGMFNNYPVYIDFFVEENKKSCNKEIGIDIAVERYNPDKLKKQLSELNTENKIEVCLLEGNKDTSFSFGIIDVTLGKVADKIESALDLATTFLVKNQIMPQTKCCLCAQTDTDDYILYTDRCYHLLMRPVHAHCVKKEKVFNPEY